MPLRAAEYKDKDINSYICRPDATLFRELHLHFMRVLRLSLLTLFLCAAIPAFAQDDAALYMEQAGGSALLYRGHRAYGYPTPFNGTYFWYGPEYRVGSVIYNGKHYDNLLLNVDAVRQDLLVKSRDGKVLNSDYVTSFTMDGRKFLNLRNIYGETAPSGYWEVLYDGRAKVLKQVVRILMQDLEGNLRSAMGYDGEYKAGVYNVFVYEEKFCYMAEDGTLTPIRRRGQILRFYKDHKRVISRHISHMESSGMLPMEQYCVEVVKYAEKL